MESVIFTFSGLRSYSLLLLALIAVSAVGACAPIDDSGPSATGEVKVFRIPWPSGDGAYTMQDISLSTFREHEKFRGDVASILVDPRIESGVVVSDEPIGRFNRQGSIFTPVDFISLQATVVYAHLERLAKVDESYDLASSLPGPARIGLSARISAGPSTPLILDNAIYDGRLDSLFFVPFTGDRLPISINAGIVAHEHYHRIFQAVILNPLREAARTGSISYGWDDSIACSWHGHGLLPDRSNDDPSNDGSERRLLSNETVPLKIYNQVLIRALNEGFADFWGWAYARDDEFVGRSLGEAESKVRRLDKPAFAIPQKILLRNSLITVSRSDRPVLKSEQGRVAAAYRFGTEYARTLRGLTEALSRDAGMTKDEAVEKVRSALARSMPQLSKEVLRTWGRSEIEPEALLKPLISALISDSKNGSPNSSTNGSPIDSANGTKVAALETPTVQAVCSELRRLSASLELLAGLCAPSPPAVPGPSVPPDLSTERP